MRLCAPPTTLYLGDAHLELAGQRGRLGVQEAVERALEQLRDDEPVGAGRHAVKRRDVLGSVWGGVNVGGISVLFARLFVCAPLLLLGGGGEPPRSTPPTLPPTP